MKGPASLLTINCNSRRPMASGTVFRSSPRPSRDNRPPSSPPTASSTSSPRLGWMMCTSTVPQQVDFEDNDENCVFDSNVARNKSPPLIDLVDRPKTYKLHNNIVRRGIPKAPSPNSVLESIMSLSLSQSESVESSADGDELELCLEDDGRVSTPYRQDNMPHTSFRRPVYATFVPPEIMPPPPSSWRSGPPKCKSTAVFQSVRFHPQVAVLEIPHVDDMPYEEIQGVYICRDELAFIKKSCWEVVDLMDHGHVFPETQSFSARGLTDLLSVACEHRARVRVEAYRAVAEIQARFADDLTLTPRERDAAVHAMAEQYHRITVDSQRTAHRMAYWDAQVVHGQRAMYEV